jgi:AraC-like DNA-binding protein
MRQVGRGRIVLWEGGSLWAFDVPGQRSQTEFHAHHAIQLTFSVGGAFFFDVKGQGGEQRIDGPAVLIAPDVLHRYHSSGRNTLLFLEPESRLGRAALGELAGQDAIPLAPARLGSAARDLAPIWDGPRPDDTALATLGRDLAARLWRGAGTAPGADPRLARVLDHVGQGGAEPDLATAAGIACLSESRFSHLFVDQIGLPFRTWLLWRRLIRAVEGIAAGSSLTEAAHAAGFADSAHFSRTFLRMFGVPASLLELL